MADDSTDDRGEDETDLVTLMLWEGGDGHGSPGLAGVERVERAHDEVAGLGGGEGRLDRLEVAHLADQDHVRVLAQRAAQRLGESAARRTPISRWLMMDCVRRREILDRVFDGDDVRSRAG